MMSFSVMVGMQSCSARPFCTTATVLYIQYSTDRTCRCMYRSSNTFLDWQEVESDQRLATGTNSLA
jgi:hypothetical protein